MRIEFHELTFAVSAKSLQKSVCCAEDFGCENLNFETLICQISQILPNFSSQKNLSICVGIMTNANIF